MYRTIWLASYPKSGNTWLRVFLANLLHPEGAPIELNGLQVGTPIAASRERFDDLLGVPSALLTQTEIDRLRPEADAELARTWQEPLLFRKTHDAFRRLADGTALMGEGPGVAAIQVLRDPRDVAVSMTHHFGFTLDEAIESLCDPAFTIALSLEGLSTQLHQHLGTWEEHTTSWLQAPLDCCLLRYEAMQQTPLNEFRRAVRFLGLPHSDAAIRAALEASRFERLRALEKAHRFRETSVHAEAFFRRGRTGEGREQLSAAQRRPLEAMHARIEALIATGGASS